jgi:hypothetical protein
MGGFGSGRGGGGPTVESALRLDIDDMMQWGAIRPGSHLGGGMRLHQLYGDDIDVKLESLAGDPENSWLCLRYSMADDWSGEELKIDDKVYLAPTRPHFGGLRLVAATAEDHVIDQDGLPVAEQELNQTAITRGHRQCVNVDAPAGGTGLLDVLLDLGGERFQE